MNLLFTDEGWEDYLFWQATDKQKLRKINQLIKDIKRTPFSGIGKPEPLKHSLQGSWSRRIDDEHRVVYEIQNGVVWILACRFHY
ncbi:MAG: hypothetical protein RL236_3 [Pseudomonadota bacterium]|jgi:toxin YoeB